MGIDRKRVQKLAGDQAAKRVESEPKPEPAVAQDDVTKHLRQVRNLVQRLQAGEDMETVWAKINRNLRYLNRAARKVVRSDGWNSWNPTNPGTQAAALEIYDLIKDDRPLATRLGHPPDWPIDDITAGPHAEFRDGRWFAYAGVDLVGEFPADAADEARDAAIARYREAYGEWPNMKPGRQRNKVTRWAKLYESLMQWA